MLDGFSTRAAWALCTFAYSAGPGTEPVLFEGRTDGKIVAARGPAHFGWDPVFEAEDTGLTWVLFFFLHELSPFTNHIHPFSVLRKFVANERADMWIVILFFGYVCSYAEMEATQKNAISHRGRALRKLRDYLQAPGTGSA
jgi:inosine/xanthosine triphosphate pyrophosphatase family protein